MALLVALLRQLWGRFDIETILPRAPLWANFSCNVWIFTANQLRPDRIGEPEPRTDGASFRNFWYQWSEFNVKMISDKFSRYAFSHSCGCIVFFFSPYQS